MLFGGPVARLQVRSELIEVKTMITKLSIHYKTAHVTIDGVNYRIEFPSMSEAYAYADANGGQREDLHHT